MLFWKSLASLGPCVLLFIPTVDSHGTEVHCDMCHFDGLDDQDCKDYGLIDNSELVAWNVASDDCMAEFNIQISTPDPSLICASANSFVNELQFGSSLTTAKLGLGVADGGFFDESGSLLSNITVSGQPLDCEATESDCFNALKSYFESDVDGQEEMADVCETLQNSVMKDRQLEQSTIRNRLCQESRDGTIIPDTCSPLWEQLELKMQEYNDTNCAFFAFGTQNQTIPGCEEDEDHEQNDLEASQSFHTNLRLLSTATVLLFVRLAM